MNDTISDTIKVDTARLPLLLNELRLPTMTALWPAFTERADREGWPTARLLATLAELELAERSQRRIQRHLIEARLPLESAIEKLDKYHLLILDDLCYVRKDQAETSVLFELIAARYERRSLLVTANHPFGEWTSVFPDAAMTLAAVDRLVHHSTIFEMNVESYRRRVAVERAARKPKPASDTKRDTDQ